jgi:phage-related protein
MAGQSVVISVLADTKKFSSDLGNASNSLGSFGKGLAGVGVAAGVALAAVGVAVGKFALDSIKAAAESERVAAQTAAVLNSTAGAAGKTAEQIGNLAGELSKMSGVDDEAIQGAENLLLTFTKIQGTNFDAATQAALDMSVAMGTDLNSAAMLVGKALNDPIKGMSALSRAGVQLTDDQKNLVKSLVETGDVAGAQAVLLGELNTQFGGSAEAYGKTFEGTVERIKNAFGNIQETIGAVFLPAIAPAFSALATMLEGIGDNPGFQTFLTNLGTLVSGLVTGQGPMADFAQTALTLWQNFSPLGIAFQVLQPLIGPLVDAFMQLADTLGGALMQVLPTVQVVIGSLVGLMGALVPVIMPVITAVLGLIEPILTLIEPLLQLVQAVMPPLVAVLTLVASTIAAVLTPVIEALTPIIQSVVDVLTGVITFLTGVFTGNWEQAWQGIQDIFKGVWELIGNIITGAWEIIVAIITGAVNSVLSLVQAWGPSLLRFISEAWNNVMAFFNSIPGLVQRAFAAAGQWLIQSGANILRGLHSGITGFWGNVTGFFASIPGAVQGALAGAGAWLIGAGRNIIDGLVNGLRNAGSAVTNMLMNIAKGAINAFKNFFGIASPSKLFTSYGKFMVQGLARGLKGSGNLVDSAMGDLSRRVDGGLNATLNVPVGYGGRGSVGGNGNASGGVTIIVNSPLATEAEVGRAVYSALNEYSRMGGTVSFA